MQKPPLNYVLIIHLFKEGFNTSFYLPLTTNY